MCRVTATSAGAFARESRAADIANEDHPTLRPQRRGARPVDNNVKPVRSLAEDVDRTPSKATMGKNLQRSAARSRCRPTDRMYS
jgi:hypothetical protein